MEIANLITALRAPDCDNCPCIECKPDRNLTRCMLFDKAADVLEALTEVKSMPKNVKCKNCANLKKKAVGVKELLTPPVPIYFVIVATSDRKPMPRSFDL